MFPRPPRGPLAVVTALLIALVSGRAVAFQGGLPGQAGPLLVDTARPAGLGGGQPAEGQGPNVIRHWRHGLIVYNKHDRFIGRSLTEYGEWCEAEATLFQQILGAWPTAVVVDVGANFGTFTTVLARLAHKGKVIAFEPQRLVFQALAATVALNQLKNVHTIQAAAGAEQGYADIPVPQYESDGINISAVSLVEGPGAAQGTETVAVHTIDGLGLEAVNFIKIDSEGMEVDVLLGARRSIAKSRPLIYMETNHVADSCDSVKARCSLEDTAMDSLRLVREWNYLCHWVRAPMFRADNFYGNPVNVFEEPGHIALILNAICAPRESKVVVKKLVEVDYEAFPYIHAFWVEEYVPQ